MKNPKTKSVKKAYDSTYFSERDTLDVALGEAIFILLKKNDYKKALDVGCGSGRLVKYLRDKKIDAYGCDKSDIAVHLARKISGTNAIFQASATKLPFPKHKFEFVSGISLIEHLNHFEITRFLDEVRRVLKPGGMVFLVTPKFSSPWRLIQGKTWFGFSDPTHLTFFTPKSLKRLLLKHKFSDVTFRFSIGKTAFDWTFVPGFQSLPQKLQYIISYALTATPLSIIRNSFWIAARSLPPAPACLNCHKPTHSVIRAMLSDKKHYFYNECGNCKLITINPFPQKIPRNLYRFSDPRIHGIQSNPQLNAASRVPGGKKLLALYIWWCNFLRFRLVSKIKTRGNLLDIGCGEGAFLKLFHKSDWNISGIEINPHLAKTAHSTTGTHIFTQPVEKVKMRSSFFDVVTLWHVLEHIPNPKFVLKKVRRTIKPGGFLILEVPNGQAMYRKIFGPQWQLLIPPQHLFLWSAQSLTSVLQRSGFNIIKISYFGIVSFSGSSSLANWLRVKNVPSLVAIYISFALFPLIIFFNLLQGNQRENLLIIAQKN